MIIGLRRCCLIALSRWICVGDLQMFTVARDQVGQMARASELRAGVDTGVTRAGISVERDQLRGRNSRTREQSVPERRVREDSVFLGDEITAGRIVPAHPAPGWDEVHAIHRRKGLFSSEKTSNAGRVEAEFVLAEIGKEDGESHYVVVRVSRWGKDMITRARCGN